MSVDLKNAILSEAFFGGSSGGGSGSNELFEALVSRNMTGDITVNAESIGEHAFYSVKGNFTVTAPNATEAGEFSFGKSTVTKIVMPKLTTIPPFFVGGNTYTGSALDNYIEAKNVTELGSSAFSGFNMANIVNTFNSVFPKVTVFPSGCFSNNILLTNISIPAQITSIGSMCFQSCINLVSVTFKGTPTTISGTAFPKSVTNINCPWSEGAVKGAPWGAKNATITYDYVSE